MLLFILSLFVLKYIAVWWAAEQRLTRDYLARQLETSVAVVLLYGLLNLGIKYIAELNPEVPIPFAQILIFLAIDFAFILFGLLLRDLIVMITEQVDTPSADRDHDIHIKYAGYFVFGIHIWVALMWSISLLEYL